MGSFFGNIFKAAGLSKTKSPPPLPPPDPDKDIKDDKQFDPSHSEGVASARRARLQLRKRRGRSGLRTDLGSSGSGVNTQAR